MKEVFKYQQWHVLSLLILLYILFYFSNADASFYQGELWGISSFQWFTICISSAILHQIYVVLTWRLELYHNSLSKAFGAKGFPIFKAGFALLILSRPVTVTCLAFSNAGSLDMNQILTIALAILFLIPSVYLFYSVKKYFGMDRAFGLDHFEPERFKNEEMIKKGIFKYTSNGMYIYGFLILYVPGLILQSKAALILALFHHIYIWVHYYFTEEPDMKRIYG